MLRRRVEAAGGISSASSTSSSPSIRARSSLPTDLSELRECVRSVQAYSSLSIRSSPRSTFPYDAHKDQHVRAVLAELAALAEQENLRPCDGGPPEQGPELRGVYPGRQLGGLLECLPLGRVGDGGSRATRRRSPSRRSAKANFARLRRSSATGSSRSSSRATVDPDTGKAIETSRMVFVEYADDVDGNDFSGQGKRRGQDVPRRGSPAFLLAESDVARSASSRRSPQLLASTSGRCSAAVRNLSLRSTDGGYPSLPGEAA